MEYLIQKKRELDRKYQSRIIFFLLAMIFAILIGRLIYLQIFFRSKYGQLSEGNRIRVIPIKAPRGLIKDRNGKIIVDNYPSYTVAAIPYQFRNSKSYEVIHKLSKILNLDPIEISRKIEENRFRPFEPTPILKNASFEIVSQIEEKNLDLPGIIIQIEPRRRYRGNEYGAHIFGYMRELSESEYKKLKSAGYKFGDMIGKSGLEKQYETYLRGKNGFEFEEVTAYGQRLGSLPERPTIYPVPGNDLILTIDWDTQKALEEAFDKDMVGAAIAIDPKNGEVIAMVSKPSYDPNLFSKGILATDWNNLINDPKKPLLNRAVQSCYPPGSTFKLVTAAAGLENKIISYRYSYMPKSCAGGFSYGNHWFGCWKASGHGRLNITDAIIQSCDTYFYQLGLKLGVQRLYDFATSCHFGQLPRIDIPVGVQGRGLIPSPQWYDRAFGKDRWSPGLVISLSIGQGEILASTLHLTSFTAAIADNGKYHRPHFVRQIVPPYNSSIRIMPSDIDVSTSNKLPISSVNLEILKEAMYGAVNAPKGTAHRAIIEDIGVAGKTGTAQNPHGEDHAWFTAFAPYDDPQIAVSVVVENGGHGGAVAAPIAKKCIEAYLKK